MQMIPSTMWQQNLRTILGKRGWDVVRHNVYGKYNHTCAYCGSQGGRVEAHEEWDYDNVRGIMTMFLVNIVCVCSVCHQVVHWGRSTNVCSNEELHYLFEHACLVNTCAGREWLDHVHTEFSKWKDRSRYQWTMDFFSRRKDIARS